jgi:hypothetical protein
MLLYATGQLQEAPGSQRGFRLMMLEDKPGGPGFQDAVVNGPVQERRDGIELALISDDRVVEPDRRISSLVHHVHGLYPQFLFAALILGQGFLVKPDQANPL